MSSDFSLKILEPDLKPNITELYAGCSTCTFASVLVYLDDD